MTSAGPAALVFDLDGTLVDSRLDIAAACNHALVATGRAALDPATIAGFVGEGARALCAQAIGVGEAHPSVEPVLAEYLRFYRQHPAAHARPLPHAREALEDRAVPLALCTNKPRSVVDPLLDALDLRRCFAVVVAGGDTPERKPSPGPLLAVARALALPPGRLWMIGDSPIDVATARAAGAFAVAVQGGFASVEALRAAAPDLLLEHLGQLPR